MVDFLVENPILLLFLVIGVGAAVGTFKWRGISLGPAAALFAGLAVGAIDERISKVPVLSAFQTLGLVLFTYTVGLASGPTFVAGLRKNGLRAIAVTVGLIALLAGMCFAAAAILNLSAADRAGLFAGATTNTPSLQAAADALGKAGNPVVAYSLAYPSAVMSMILLITLLLGKHQIVPARLAPPPSTEDPEPVVNWTVRVTRPNLPALGAMRHLDGFELGFSRLEHEGQVDVATESVHLQPGDLVVVVGPERGVEAFCHYAGHRSDRHLALDRSAIDFRRIVVSNRKLAGRAIADLDLPGRFGVTPTRVRRGDDDLLCTEEIRLQLGDRLRVVGPGERLGDVARFLGDSERSNAEVEAIGFALGIVAGLALGALAIPLPGGVTVELGPGGGPLVVGLVLGVLGRLGPITFQIPQGPNLAFRQIGILMFLACAGLRSGTTFAEAVQTRAGLELAAAGLIVALTFATCIAIAAQVLLRRDVVEASGVLAGVETQPAALSYASTRTAGNERVAAAYALVFPVAMIVKIIAVQFLV